MGMYHYLNQGIYRLVYPGDNTHVVYNPLSHFNTREVTMPIFDISFNDYEETWEAYRVDWEDETRVLDVVAIDTYSVTLWSSEKQTDYSVFVERDNIGDAFIAGVKMIEGKISEQVR